MPQQDLVDGTDDAALAAGASTIGIDHARALVRRFAAVTTSKDVDAFVAGFTDDCIVHYGRFPEMRGKAALRAFMPRLFPSRLGDFVCRKTLRSSAATSSE
jgi:ketosteroid isomerase-like protein